MNPALYRRAAEIFIGACDLRKGERARFIAESCRGDGELHDAVMRLIENDEKPAPLVEAPSFDGGGAMMLAAHLAADGEGTTAPARMPDRVGRYRILEVLGRGGMGVVYEAEQDRPRRRVALKVLRHDAVTGSILRRFRQEADLLGRLRHPGIAQIYEAGAHDAGEGAQPFFAMELVAGRPILEYASAHGLDTRARLELVTAMCDAVHHAHEQGVIHRDLKPDNVLVVQDDTGRSAGQPKILDFGVARATDADVQTVTLHTATGQIVGTVAYMSPEQAGGDPADIDRRSDVYALGVILYELLAGRMPYPVHGKMIHEVVRIIREEEPSRLTTFDRSFRGDVETIVGRALEKDKDRRYQSVADLAADIRRYLADEPILARPTSTWYQMRKFARRNRTLVAGVAMTLAVLAAGVVVATALAIRSHANADAARRQSYRAGITAASAVMLDDPGTAARYLEATPPQLRGWEWRHLKSLLDPHTLSYVGPAKPGSHLAFTGDGGHLVATLADGTVAVWKAGDATLVRTIAEDAPVQALAVTAAGPGRLALGTAGGRVIMCGLDGADRVEVRLDSAGVEHLAWNGSGTRLAAIGDRRLFLWQAGKAVQELEPRPLQPVLAFSPDGTRLAGLHYHGTSSGLVIWDMESGQGVAGSGLARHYPRSLAWSHDGTRILIGTTFRLVAEVDPELREVSRWLVGHRAFVGTVAGSPTGDVASTGGDGTIRLWRDGSTAAVLDVGHDTPIAFTPDGAGLAYNAGDEIRLWDLAAGAATVIDRHTSYVYQVDFSPDGTLLASGTYPVPEVFVWDAIDAHCVASMTVPEGASFVGFNADGQLRVNDGLYDPATAAPLGPAEPALGAILLKRVRTATWGRIAPSHACSDDGTLMAIGSRYVAAAGSISVIDTQGALRLELPGSYWGAAFSPDTTRLAAAGDSGVVEIRDLATGDLLVELGGHAGGGPAYCVAFHPDGTRLASGGNDGTIRLWDTTTWQEVHEMRGHTSYVKSLAFSPDGTRLASGSGDFTVRLWDTVSRAVRARQSRESRRSGAR